MLTAFALSEMCVPVGVPSSSVSLLLLSSLSSPSTVTRSSALTTLLARTRDLTEHGHEMELGREQEQNLRAVSAASSSSEEVISGGPSTGPPGGDSSLELELGLAEAPSSLGRLLSSGTC